MSNEQIRFTVDPSSVEGFLPSRGDAIIAALTMRTTAINIALQAKIAGVKLQGNPIKSHTNKLAGSVRVIPTQNDGSNITGGVQAGGGPAFYAKYLEGGTGLYGPKASKYPIMAKNGKALMFGVSGGSDYSPWGGKFSTLDVGNIFVKKVMHPGVKAYGFMKGTLEEERANIVLQLKAATNEAAQ